MRMEAFSNGMGGDLRIDCVREAHVTRVPTTDGDRSDLPVATRIRERLREADGVGVARGTDQHRRHRQPQSMIAGA
jgi:hypothetical protein